MSAIAAQADPVTRQLADMLATTTIADVPVSVQEHVHRATVDWIGCAIAGAIEPPARMGQRLVAALGASTEATVFTAGPSVCRRCGARERHCCAHARAGRHPQRLDVHARGAGDFRRPRGGGARTRRGPRFPARGHLGYEAALRIGEAVNPSHYRYWHPTGTVGTFGAAAAAGRRPRSYGGPDVRRARKAGTQAAGLWEFNADGAMSKHLHPGKAAMNGMLSADLATHGFTGATRILEGARGFFGATTAAYDAAPDHRRTR